MANIVIDDDTQPRYVPEDVYYAPTADEYRAGVCTHETTYRDGYWSVGGFYMTVHICDECGGVL